MLKYNIVYNDQPGFCELLILKMSFCIGLIVVYLQLNACREKEYK